MSETDTPSHQDSDDTRRRAFLLDQLSVAKDRRLAMGPANAAIPAAIARELGLSPGAANAIRAALAAEGYMAVGKAGRTVTYTLTDSGAAHLVTIRQFVPRQTAGNVIPPSNDTVRRARVSYLLLQLLRSERHTLAGADANRFDAVGRSLELNAATARHIRGELAAEGLISVARSGRAESYTLTPAGRLHLGALSFHDDFVFSLTGKVLNDLLEAARDAAKQFESTTAPAAAEPPSADELRAEILLAFDELSREAHADTGLVPIHEVRAAIRDRFGPGLVRHDAFDEAVLALWRSKRVRLTPIADRGRATPDQLRDGIAGVGETLFYLEPAHAAAPA